MAPAPLQAMATRRELVGEHIVVVVLVSASPAVEGVSGSAVV